MVDDNRQGSGKMITLILIMVVLMGTLAFVGMKSIDKRTGSLVIKTVSQLWAEDKYEELEDLFVNEIGFVENMRQLDKELDSMGFEENTKSMLKEIYRNVDIRTLDEFKAKEFGDLDKLAVEYQEDKTLKVYRVEMTYINLNELGNKLRQTHKDAVAMGKTTEDMQRLYEIELKNANSHKKTEVLDVITIVQEGKVMIISKDGEISNQFANSLMANPPKFLGNSTGRMWKGGNVPMNTETPYDDQGTMLIRPEIDPYSVPDDYEIPEEYNVERSESVLSTDGFNFTSEGYDETIDNTSMDFEDPSMYFGD